MKSIFSRPDRLLRFLASACGLIPLFFLTLTGCAGIGGGVPTGHAETVIRGHSLDDIKSKTEDVFYRHGFETAGLSASEMRFDRRGGVTENLLYGNWNENTTITQVTVYFIPMESGDYRLRLRSDVVRDTFGGSSNARMFDVQGARYAGLLSKIKRELMAN